MILYFYKIIKKEFYHMKILKKINLKKAAMFGLDARIALAIFGALSVISGAALYSAIQNAKVTAVVTEIKEFEKSIEALYIDLGYLVNMSSDTYKANGWHRPDIRYLTTNTANLPYWNGPYLTPAYISTDNLRFADGYEIKYSSNSILNCAGSGGYGLGMVLTLDRVGDDTNCNIDVSLLKKIHDKFDSDGNYTSYSRSKIYSSRIIYNDDQTKGVLLITIPSLIK
jgi:hypothetical protein